MSVNARNGSARHVTIPTVLFLGRRRVAVALLSTALISGFFTPTVVLAAGPTTTVAQAVGQADPTGTSPINFTVTFSDPVEGFTSGDLLFGGSGSASFVAVVTGGPKIYNVAVSGMTTAGDVIASVPSGGAYNPAGEPNEASTNNLTDNYVTWAPGGPSVTINEASGQLDPASASPIKFDVTYSTDIDVRLVDLSKIVVSGTAGGTKVVAMSQAFNGDFRHWTLAVTGMTTGGTVAVSMPEGVLTTIDGKPSHASTSSDNTVTWSAPPTVTINQAAGQLDPTGMSPINFAVLFSAPVTGFAAADVAIGGTAGGTKSATVTGSGTTYNVAVSGMTTTGTVFASIPAGAAVAAGALGNLASISTDNSVTWTPAPPGAITLTTSAPIPPGAKDPVILWGQGFTLGVSFGTAGANRAVQVQGTRDGSAWSTITTLTTDATGHASLVYRPVTNLFYRAVFAGAPDLAAATSNQVRTVARQLAVMRPTNRGSTTAISRNASVTFTTTVRPSRPELDPAVVTFSFSRRIGGTWQLVTTQAVAVDSSGAARTIYTFATSGEWSVRSQAGPTPYNANSVPTPSERYSVR